MSKKFSNDMILSRECMICHEPINSKNSVKIKNNLYMCKYCYDKIRGQNDR